MTAIGSELLSDTFPPFFDEFCRLVEKNEHLRQLKLSRVDGFPYRGFRDVLKAAAVFEFEAVPHEVLPKRIEDSERITNLFALPFRTVAIQDKASLLILIDRHEEAVGLESERFAIEFTSQETASVDHFQDSEALEETRKEIERSRKNKNRVQPLYVISLTRIERLAIEENCRWQVHGSLVMTAGYTPRDCVGVAKDLDGNVFGTPEEHRQWEADSARNLIAAFEEIAYLNTPDRFVLEIAPEGGTKPANKFRIPRADERPRYTLLTPGKIRRIMVPDEQERARIERDSPVPHARRRHERTFRNEKFSAMQGKTIVVKAAWIGPEAVVRNGRRYRVRLDL